MPFSAWASQAVKRLTWPIGGRMEPRGSSVIHAHSTPPANRYQLGRTFSAELRMTARTGGASLFRRSPRLALGRCGLAFHDLVEAALLPTRRILLVHQRQSILIELVKPLVP